MNRKHARAARTFAAAFALALALAALAALAARAAQEQSQPGAPTPTSTPPPRSAIYGRAVSEATGRPLRRAPIRLMTPGGLRVDQSALTNAHGEFRVAGLPAGRYVVWADVSGMLTPAAFLLGVADPALEAGELRRHFEVVELDGKAEREVTVRARRGGAVTGRVTYADGDPAVNLQVFLLRRGEGPRPLTPARVSGDHGVNPRTDDRGVYRIAGLLPGEYVIAVAESADHTGARGDAIVSTDLAGIADLLISRQLLMTYHPAATSAKGAVAVTVRAGEESADVDVTIPDRELRTVTGVVRAARGGRPVRWAKVHLAPRHEELGGDRSFFDFMEAAMTNEEGRWQLREIPDGLYTVYVKAPEEDERDGEAAGPDANRNARNMNAVAPATRPRQRFAPLRRELRVSGDVDELVLELGEGGRVAGTVVVEGARTPQHMYVYARRVAQTVAEAAGDAEPQAPVSAGRFELEGMAPGRYFLHARDFSEEGDLYLKSVTWQGRDLLREPLEVGEGARVEGVRIVYGSDPSVLTVRAWRAGKEPAPNVNVFLLPADLAHWTIFRPQLFCSTGDEGSCRISAPPGEYAVVTTQFADLLADPESELRRRALDAPRVTLRAGEGKTLETVVKAGP